MSLNSWVSDLSKFSRRQACNENKITTNDIYTGEMKVTDIVIGLFTEGSHKLY